MDLDGDNRFVCASQGQLLRLNERREVAIYLRKDALWVADFIDGHGELIDVITWFRSTVYARFFTGAVSNGAQIRHPAVAATRRENQAPASFGHSAAVVIAASFIVSAPGTAGERSFLPGMLALPDPTAVTATYGK